MNSPVPSKQLIIPQHVKINEFSPEWDYVTGGSKVLICFTPQLTVEHVNELECAFGDAVVPVRFVQDGVFKCNAPPSDEPGFVRLTILRNGESITLDSDVNVVNEF